MKYLIIAAIVSLVAAFVYLRVRPYLQLIRKIVSALNTSTEVTTTAPRRGSPPKSKLVRCDSCGTWVPADRVFSVSSGLANYCSRECLAKKSESEAQKLAG